MADVTWSLAAGSIGWVIGPSGSGKSRLLRLVNRLDDADAGSVEVFGQAVNEWTPRELRCDVGWVPQAPTLSAGTARYNIEQSCRLGVISQAQLDSRIDEACAVAGVTDAMAKKMTTVLSGGERYRVGLARALVLHPRLLILDEPTGSLDGAGGAALLQALRAWRADHDATLLIVTHRLGDVRALGGELLMLEHGRVVESGSVEELLAGDRGERIRALLAGDAS